MPDDVRDPHAWLAWLAAAFEHSPMRFEHSKAVWIRMRAVVATTDKALSADQARTLELAALLHDVGRAIDPDNRRPHAFTAADLLDAVGLGDVATIVAHHSGAEHEAELRGLQHLDRWREFDSDLVAMLTYLDRTTGADGATITVAERRAGLVARYGIGSTPVLVLDSTLPTVARGRVLCEGRA